MSELTKALHRPRYMSHAKDKKASVLSTIITTVGNFGVQMNYQAISVALIVMSVSVCTKDKDDCKDGEQETWVLSSATAVVFAGSIAGQLCMGYAGDVMGRTNAMGLTQFIAIISALFSAVLPMGDATQKYMTIIICRFFLGIGLGGVYPLAATKAAEDASSGGTNPAASAKSFFWQTPGSLAPWILALIFTASDLSTNMRWRLLLGLGVIPGTIVLICVMLENEQRYERTHKPSLDINDIYRKESIVAEAIEHKDVWLKLIGTGGSWFIFDVCYYGVGLFGGEILDSMGGESDDISSDHSIVQLSWKQLVALSMGIPGVILTISLMPYMTLKNLQIAGFFLTAIGFVVMAVCFFPLKKHFPDVLFAMYCFLLFALQFGPNVTTYVIPSTVYPKEVRSTMNGLSAASGKLGAVAGAYIFGAVVDVTSLPTVMTLCACLSVVGMVITYYFIEELEDDESEEGMNASTSKLIDEKTIISTSENSSA